MNYITYQDIKAKYGLHPTTIITRCRKLGIVPIETQEQNGKGRSPHGVTYAELAQILTYKHMNNKELVRVTEIAGRLGYHSTTVMEWCDFLNVIITTSLVDGCMCNTIRVSEVPKLHKYAVNHSTKHRVYSGSTKTNYNRDRSLYSRILENYTPKYINLQKEAI